MGSRPLAAVSSFLPTLVGATDAHLEKASAAFTTSAASCGSRGREPVMVGGVVNWDPLVSVASVLAVLAPLVMLVTRWERRSNYKAYGTAWKEVCHVLADSHVHEGTMLRGTWKGRGFVASAIEYWAGEYAGTVSRYG